MAEQLIISISGMRGIVGKNLTDSVAHDYGCAFGTFLKDSFGGREKMSVCIGRDSRASGPILESAVASGLCDTGFDVVDIGVVPTPSVGVMVQQLGCGGGVVITASHNTIQYNGIKLLLANSIAPPPEKAEQIKRLFLDRRFSLADSHNRGKLTSNEQADEVHISRVLSTVDSTHSTSSGQAGSPQV
ncbi:MAG: hypothetical protein MUO27_03145, partial [Sedimentisphaerales bacterium]|nr:hypothetical protein [Sedimentisphaerales bacterium]